MQDNSPATEAEVRAIIEQWGRLHDQQAGLSAFLPLIAEEEFYMQFGDARWVGYAEFEEHQRTKRKFFDEVHEYLEIKVEPGADRTLALASSADAAKTPGGVLCEKRKLEATAKLLKCRQDADAAYGKTQNETKRDKDYTRCERRLTGRYTRLETKVFPDTGALEDKCPTYGDAANIIAFGAAATALVTNGQASANAT